MPETLQQTHSLTLADGVASQPIPLKGVRRVTVFCTNTGAGNAHTYAITVSGDDSTYVTYNKIITNQANTNGETLVRTATIEPGAVATKFGTMDLENDACSSMKVTGTLATAGTMTAKVVLEYY